MRTVPTEASAERARDRQTGSPFNNTTLDLNPDRAPPDYSQPPEGFSTQRPATGDYYEVRGGSDNRIYGFFPTMPGHSSAIQDIATAAKRYVNDLTGRDDAFIQYRAGDPVQATAPNGVPLWIVYELDSGNVVHTFADHDQTSAWATAQAWLRGIGAEDPSLFSCRAKMST